MFNVSLFESLTRLGVFPRLDMELIWKKKFLNETFFLLALEKVSRFISTLEILYSKGTWCVINKKKKKDGRIFLFLTREKFVLSIEWFLLEEKDGQNDSDHVHYSQLFKIHLMDPEETRKWTH